MPSTTLLDPSASPLGVLAQGMRTLGTQAPMFNSYNDITAYNSNIAVVRCVK
jgi:hypothetical protein